MNFPCRNDLKDTDDQDESGHWRVRLGRWSKLHCPHCFYLLHLNPSDVRLRNELRATLGTPQKFLADSLRKLHDAVHSDNRSDALRAWQKKFQDTLSMRLGRRTKIEMNVTDWSGLAEFIGNICEHPLPTKTGCEEEDIAWCDTVTDLMKQAREVIKKTGTKYPDMDYVIRELKLEQ